MLRLLFGSVTLAAAGYAVKEYCDTYGCPWDDAIESYDENSTQTEEKNKSFKQAKEFHKQKKVLYKKAMVAYQEFLQNLDVEDAGFDHNAKIKKQKFPDDVLDSEVQQYIKKSTKEMKSNFKRYTSMLKLFTT